MEITPVKKVTITEQIMEQLATQIIDGKLAAGEQLPTERELAVVFNVTRSRVREALRALSLIGMIVIKPGEGTFVSDNKVLIPDKTITWIYHKELNNVEDIYAARQLIETDIYLSCFDRANRKIVAQMRKLINEIAADGWRKISSVEFLENLNNLDLYVGSECGNGIYFKLMQTLVLLRTESSIKILNSSAARKSAIMHREKIVCAFEEESRDLLEQRLNEFFEDSLKSIIKK